jgi:conserved hypothetical protein
MNRIYYHGTTDANGINFILLPPVVTDSLSEKGRKKNLDRVFYTHDLGLARIYAGRAARSIGGNPIILRVVTPVDAICMNDADGASVYHCSWAFCEPI